MAVQATVPPCAAVFEALRGRWQLRRTLTSKLPGFPSGAFDGSVTFVSSSAFNGDSLLYHETGTLTTESGLTLMANRKYVYRFDTESNKLSVWFTKEDGHDSEDVVDYLYHDLEFQLEQGRWVARGDHLCDNDMYWSFYDFRLDQASGELTMWGMKQQVKGPDKDYSTDTVYQRESSDSKICKQ